MSERLAMQFAVGVGLNSRIESLDGCRLVDLGEVEKACSVLGLRLESAAKPEDVIGNGSPHQWYVAVSIADGRMAFVSGDKHAGDLRDTAARVPQ